MMAGTWPPGSESGWPGGQPVGVLGVCEEVAAGGPAAARLHVAHFHFAR